MKLRKLISTALTVGLILNNIPTSFASVLSEDGRLETFEGSNITIDNILEEDTVDVEIEGNTMVNVANQKDAIPITKGYTVEGTNRIPLQGEYDGKAKPVIKGNTMYYNNDTGELSDTFVEGVNLSLVSSFEDQLVTQDMVDSGQEDAKNLGKYKVELKSVGKNLFNEDNIIRSSGTYGYVDTFNDFTNATLTLIDKDINADISGCYLGFNRNDTIEWIVMNGNTDMKSATRNIKGVLYYPNNQDTVDKLSSRFNIQLEEGDTATEYEPYKESIKTFYLNSPLLEGDTIENINGKATHVKRYNKVVLDGSEDWILRLESNSIGELAYYHLVDYDSFGNSEDYIIDKFNYYGKTANPGVDLQTEGFARYTGANHLYLSIYKSRLSSIDADGLKEWLSENPITIIYKLNEPIYENTSEEPILIDSYKDGHLDLNTNIPVNKVDFISNKFNLNYLYPSTEYTVQFESDNAGKIDKVSLGDETLYSDYSVIKGINRFNITTPSEISSIELILDGIGFNLSNLVVTEATNESFDYFEGIQSVGQNDVSGHNIEVIANNKNLFDYDTISFSQIGNVDIYGEVSKIENETFVYTGSDIKNRNYGILLKNIKLKPNTNYNLSYILTELSNCSYPNGYIRISSESTSGHKSTIYENVGTNALFKTNNSTSYNLAIYGAMGNISNCKFEVSNIIISESKDTFIKNQSNTIQVPLSEPLRSLPNGVKDKIIKRNGQWVVERNICQITLNGTEKWITFADKTDLFLAYVDVENAPISSTDIISSKFKTSRIISTSYNDGECISSRNVSNGFILSINKSRFDTTDSMTEFIEWLKNNNIEVIYRLSEPKYEPLNIDPTISLYLDTTHISNNSNISANMKVTIDRTINIASEAIELAKENPTTENLARARMWVNLLKESTLKDELQGEISGITDLEDMVLEKKSATANLDVYIKSENMLSMSLNTNSITFDNYSGVEDMKLENAIGISINSSLPYDLTASLASDIKGSQDNNTMDMDMLKIKDSSKNDYQSFINTTDKVILNEDCSAGNYISHNIDLKLESNNAYVPDVYKTTIKFEATQK